MKVVLVSLDQARGDKAENRRRVQREMDVVAACKPDLVIFPEMTLTGYTMRAAEFGEDESLSPTIDFFSGLAKKYNTYMAFGLIVKEPGLAGKAPGFTNNLVIVDKEGRFVTRYRKIHPFSYSGEDKHYVGGEKLGIFRMSEGSEPGFDTDSDSGVGIGAGVGVNVENATSEWTIGLTVCYDLRFPELYQGLSRTCDCIINIANWPAQRVTHWRTLLQARAIENQCYILGVNRSGTDGKTSYEKSSPAIDPQGKILQPKPLTEISDLYEIDLATVVRARTTFPVRNDRKPSLYQKLYL